MAPRQVEKWIYRASVVAALALVAWLQASAVSSLARAWLADSEPHGFVPPLVVAPPPVEHDWVAVKPPAPVPLAAHDAVVTLTDCPGVELSIVSEARDPAFSLASVRPRGGSYGRLLREGSHFGQLELVRVGYDVAAESPAAWFRRARGVCRVLLFSGSRALEPVVDEPVAAPKVEPPASSFAGIQRLGAHDFAIDRSLVERLLASLGRSRDGVPMFTKEDGQIRGVTLRSVRRGGWVEALGLESGDRLEAVNGRPLQSPRQVLEAYGALREARELSLTVFRAGAQQQLNYEIR